MSIRKMRLSGTALLIGALSFVLMTQSVVFAHCDTMDGPVVVDAQMALASGDVASVLKWVPKADEAEIRQMFAKTLVVRTKGPEAKEMADTYFLETLVRIHRASEGVAYTGIKPVGTPIAEPIAKSDASLKTGNVDELAQTIADQVKAEIQKRFAVAFKASKHKDQSVKAGRQYVAAYVAFVHYVESVHDLKAAHGHGEHRDQAVAAVHED